MSKVTIDMSEFIHLKGESVYNHDYYKHKEHGYTILQVCEEQFETLHFYKLDDQNNKVFLFSCRWEYEQDLYEGELGDYWS
jgi:hypothetical protein